MTHTKEIAMFGGGCFWCTEAVYENLRGVISVMPGYAGGEIENPTYDQVSMGKTGHAEVIRIEFDPAQISFKDLLTVFFATHDPTTFNRQGNDIGTQYRSIILYTNYKQKTESEAFIREVDGEGANGQPAERGASSSSPIGRVVTEVKPLEKFYEAEDYHRQYYQRNLAQPYCQIIINPKVMKVKEKFRALLKSS